MIRPDVLGKIENLQLRLAVRVESEDRQYSTRPLRAIIDSGADRTCIRESLAADLALVPFDRANIHVPGHAQPQVRPWYRVRLVFNPGGAEIVTHPDAVGIPVISNDTDVLVGMDILSISRMFIDGPARGFMLQFGN